MPITATRFTQFRPLGGDQDGDGFADNGDILRHTLTLNNTGTAATSVVVNDLLGGSTENGNLNISPIAFADSYTAVGNTLMEVGNATSQTAPQSNVVGNILNNDVDFFSDTFTISAFDATSLNGGTVNVITTGVDAGSFTYVSAANFTGSDTFTYTIRDDGLDGIAGNSDDLVSIGTVTITVSNQVWYVDSSFVGVSNGTSTNPFTTLAAVTGATGPDTDGDTIYVNTGAGNYTGGITLLNNQILHGEGTALVVGGFNLAAAGTDPTITNAAGNGVTLAQGNTLTGFTVGNTTGFDIANTTAATVGNLTISNVDLTGTGGLFRADSGGALTVTFDTASTTSATAAGNGIHLTNVTGNFTATAGAISGVDGIDVLVSGGTATIAIGSSITSSVGGSIDIGSHATGNVTLSGAINITGGTGISVHNNTSGIIAFTNGSKVVSTLGNNAVDLDTNTGATVNFTGGGLDIDTTTGLGFQATGGGTFSVTGSGNSVTTTTGTALDLNGMIVGVNGVTFATATTNGAANGILITSVSQSAGSTGIDVLGGAIVNASSRGVDILSSSADVAIASTISTTAAGRSVEVTDSGGSGGRTIVFSGAIDENGQGINLANNDQLGGIATINFTGGLDIDSTTFTGFSATAGGTINITGTNTINNTTGVGINVDNTTIGASGLTFQTIASSSTSGGIILNTTGAGAFTVTGTGAAFSGGTISGATGVNAGINLINTGAVTLNYIRVQNGQDDGIRADNVAGLRVDNSSVLNNGNAVNERGLDLHNVTGTVTLLNSIVTGNAEDNFRLHNETGTVNLTITGSTFADVSTAFGNDGVHILADGNSTVIASITGSTFTNHRGDHFQVTTEADSNSTTHFTFSGNTLTGDRGVNYGGNDLGGSITINPGALTGTSNMTFNIANNNIQGAVSSGITINRSGDTGTLQGTIQGNTIGTAGTADSGSSQAHGIDIVNNDNGTVTVLVHDNDIFQYANLSGINIINRDGSGRLNATVTNNVINSPGQFGTHGIHVQNGAASGDAGDIYLDMENNTLAGSGANGGADFRIRQRFDADIFLESYGGGQWDTAAVVSYLQGRNTGVETGTATVHAVSPDPNGYFTTGAGTVPQPNSPTLPPAPLFVNPVPLPDAGKSAGDGTGGDFVPPGSTDPTDPAPGATDPVWTLPGSDQPIVVDDGVVSAAELALIVEAAIQRWADAGATEEQIAAMRAVTVSVENMSGLQIGSNEGGHITLDDNAAGFNWFIDATPGDDSEYSGSGTQLTAIPGTVAAMRVDLLTTVMHELGHQIGLTDTYASSDHDELMYGLVSMGERRLPGSDDLSGATGSPVSGIAFSLTPINIGNIPAGQVVVVMWDSVVNGYTNQLVPTFTNFSTVTGNNPGAFSVNSNSETMGPGGANNIILDSLTLGNLVFLDANNNGMFDGADTGVNGVTLTLFADTNANGVFDSGIDVQLATAITAGGGLYSFANLSPGDYIVRVDAANFNVGGALVSRLTATGGSDPDDNTDNDDNGVNGAGGIVVSQAITLSHDNEPTPGASNDTNNTLDFGFIQLNQGPVNTVPGTQTINEDATHTFTGGTAISVNDPDVGAGNLTVTISVLNGQLTLSGTAGLAFGAGDGTDDTTMTFTGTQAAVNAALNGLLYETTLDYNGSDTLTINTNDNGNTGSDPGLTGGANDEQDTDIVTINITAVADAVTDTPTVGEDSGANNLDLLANDSFENPGRSITSVTQGLHGFVSINDNNTVGLTTDDFVVYTPVADYEGADSFTYTVSSGGVTEIGTVNVTVSAVADIADDAPTVGEDSGTTTIDVIANDSFENGGFFISAVTQGLHGTVTIIDGPDADLNPDYVTYTPTADYNGSDSFTYQVTSGGVTETATVNVTVTAVADIADDSAGVIEDSVDNALDLLANDTFENAGRAITAVGAALHGTTAIDDAGTPGDATDDFVTYTPTGGYVGPDSFTYTVTSGGVTETATVSVNVAPANEPPVVDLNTGTGGFDDSAFYVEGGTDVAIGAAIGVTDTEGDNVVSATITITDPETGDLLFANLPLPGGITIDGASTDTTLILTGSASAATYATALGQVGFTSSSEDPTDGGTNPNRVITVTASDAGGAGAAATMTLTVIGVNDEPTLIATGLDPTFPENTAAVDLYSTVTADTVEGGQTFTSMTLTVTNVFDGANEILTFDGSSVALTNGNSVVGTATNGLTVNVAVAGSTATVTFTGATLSEAALQTLVDALAYRNSAIPPTDGDRVITITQVVDSGSDIGDNDNESAPNIVSTVDVEPNNQAPVVDLDNGTGGVNYSTPFIEDGVAVAIGSGVAVTDANSGSGDMIESATIVLTDRVAGDALTVTGVLPPGIIAVTTPTAGAITIQITGTGTGAQYQALIESIQYSTTSQDPTVGGTDLARTITVTANDGTIDSAVATTTVNITALDDAPVAQPDAFTITEAGSIVGGNVFANNGSGPDSDPDGPPLAVSAVSGGTVGVQFMLPSGALLTMNANGTFDYNPNGAFNPTPTPGSGASNQPAPDSFTYTLAGGNTTTVSLTIQGLDTNDTLLGTAGADTLSAGVGNDYLDPGAGADTMSGGTGNDIYWVDNAGDVVNEAVGEGQDTVFARVNYALTAGSAVEVLAAGMAGAVDLTGNELANAVYGNEAVNFLIGGGGADVLEGFGGNDTLYGGSAGDYLDGGADNDALEGLGGVDTLRGGLGNDYIDGGAGADLMTGGGGNDIYWVDAAGDVVTEAASEGQDTVFARVNYALTSGSEIEVLAAGTAGALNLTGNALANSLYGNNDANLLSGGGGADALEGFGGNDTLYGGSVGDYLDGGADDDVLEGFGGTDTLRGGLGSDYLDGGTGADTMAGGGGDDIYWIDNAGDVVNETIGEGQDIVFARATYTLTANSEVEVLSASGISAMNLTGNGFANAVYGNSAANVLDGGLGADVLIGNGGADSFAFTTTLGAGNVDTIFDFLGIGTGFDDVIQLDDAVFTGLALGALDPSAFFVGTAAQDADDRIIYDTATGALYFDADGNGAGVAVQFAFLDSSPALTAGDFTVI